MGRTGTVLSQDDVDSTVVTVTDSLVVELGRSLYETLHIQDDLQGDVLNHVPTLDMDEIGHLEGMMFPELKVEQSKSSVELGRSLDEALHIEDDLQVGVLNHVPTSDTDEIGHLEGMMSPELKIEQSKSSVELGRSLDEALQIQDDLQGGVLNHVPTSDTDEIGHLEGMMSPELKVEQSKISVENPQKSFSKSATFRSSEEMLSPPMSMDRSVKKSESCAGARSMSLHTPPLKLVSAMKGGREQQGTPWKMKLNVTWAPDVYDPPPVSLSNMVRSHNQRSRTKRKDHKHKHSKGKSTRGSNNEKKHHMSWKSSSSAFPLRLRLHANADRLPLDDFVESSLPILRSQGFLNGESSIEIVSGTKGVSTQDSKCGSSFRMGESGVEIVSNQDSNCGTSFLRASLAKVHLSFTEAL
ncbi:uncharacterized protein LOC143872896 [Tasmannia lanceolata]|uniref:uncharacterized protein LOC143872896 n=1 Tax=Tasmannia lanceolata TaxID=3420 RepID=UPI004064252C